MIIGVSGKARSGKGEFARIAKEEFGAEVVSFAGALKEEVANFLNSYNISWRPENLYGANEFREETFVVPQSCFQDYGFKSLLSFCNIIDGEAICTYRSLLQWWGTEFRRAQDDDYWVKRALEKCNSYRSDCKFYVIDDLRFENEAGALLDTGARLIRVERPNNPNPISNPWHPSETGLDEWIVWNYVVENSGTLEEYQDSVRFVLCDILGINFEDRYFDIGGANGTD